ncbi:hypothetical protein AKJ57_06090 [candidate division MSBL1 archaeon SCGC-AAA259A05]|uniref:Uncharacterized protein n=1 Tax=candidate division MSBL1 archaeon SCGC-AAA259A05 TaxID=1698259 RepID=A0A133U428_9EURY|nr:hypothetical protein AKJ57_06090 [candidate division MSBL1 archaeon SCGC-AAA259A05]
MSPSFQGRKAQRGGKLNLPLPLKRRIPKGEYMEEFLKERSLWEDFKSSTTRRHLDNEILALEVFIRNKRLKEEFLKFRDVRLVGVRLSGRMVSER